MEWIKAGVSGLVGSFVAFLLFVIYVNSIGVVPFYLPESHAAHKFSFLLPLEFTTIVFIYGIFWSLVLVFLFHDRVTIWKGIGLGVVLWLFMMVVYGPYLNWGFFGFHGETIAEELEHLVIDSPWSYILLTLVLHLVYGFVTGLMNKKWIHFEDLALPKAFRK